MTESGSRALQSASPLATNSLISWGFLGGWSPQRGTRVTEVLVDYGIKWEYSNNDTMKKVRRVRDASRSRLYIRRKGRAKRRKNGTSKKREEMH
jgi:hypothetical protein